MKIYLMQTASGSWEDYRTHIEKGFTSKDAAVNCANKYNEELQKQRDLGDLCDGCQCGKYRSVDSALKECKRGANIGDVSEVNGITSNVFFKCAKYVDYYWNVEEEHDATILEIEVE